jgi:hypothetical protein
MAINPPDLHVPPTCVNGHSRKPASSVTAAQASHKEREQDEMEVEANRTFKKRRTSSEAPEDRKEDVKEHVEAGDQIRDIVEMELQKHLQDIGREAEADPSGSDWEDLDAEDADDPMMVSEYVTETRGAFLWVTLDFRSLMGSFSKKPSQTRTIWTARRTWHGRCADSLPTG